MSEIWMPVFQWEGIYEVSTRGQVRSCRTGRYLKPYIASGYERVMLQVNARKANERKTIEGVHRLVLAAHTKMMPRGRNGIVCCHKNGNKRDNRLENLEWKSPLENMLDKNKHGTMPKGAAHKRSKLTESDVLQIRESARQGYQTKTLASHYKVSTTHIYMIVNRQTWRHL